MISPVVVQKKAKASSSSQNIKVFLRCRPMNSHEKAGKSYNIVNCQNGREVVVKERPTDKFAKTFTFDRVFGPESKQIDVYRAVAKNSVDEVLNGFNCTIFAYGQTGTGKTFTMEGERGTESTSWEEDPLSGIIPRCVTHLFDELRIQKVEFTMRVSFLELYNEELFDLLSAHDDMSKLRLYEDASKKGSCIIHGLEEVLVRSKADVYSILEKGSTKRQTAATLMNAHSSRSHTVFTVTIHMKENTLDGDELLKTGKLHLVDLAGSENIGRSGAVDKRAREAGNINMSLLTLGRVITSLVEKAPHIPYRESKLTRLLQDALGGRTKTSVIATISPASINQEETLSTLEYAHRAKNIQNKPEVNQKLNKKELIGEYSQEIERLRRDLMAMREKSGVYLANENYQEILNTMEIQAQEITEKIAHIRALEEEAEKYKDMFTQKSQQLESTAQELNSTQEKLANTQNTLSCTQRLLHTTAQEREEQKYLVSVHSKTEEKLKSEGQSLITVASSTTSDLTRLHDKLERKKNVEKKNAQVTREFQDTYMSTQEALSNDVTSVVTQQTKVMTDIISQCNESLQHFKTEAQEIGEGLSSLSQQQATLINATLNHLRKAVEELVGGVRGVGFEAEAQYTRQGEAVMAFQDKMTAILDRLASFVSSCASSVSNLLAAQTDKLQKIEEMSVKVQQQQQSLSVHMESEVSERLETLKQHMDKCNAMLTTQITTTDTHAQSLTERIDTLVATLGSMKEEVDGYREGSSASLSSAKASLAQLKEEAEQGASSVNKHANHFAQESEMFISTQRTIVQEAHVSLGNYIDELESCLQHGGNLRCEAETAVSDHVTVVKQSLASSIDEQKVQLIKLEEGADRNLGKMQEEMETMQTFLSQELAGQRKVLLEEAEGVEGAASRLTREVDGVCTSLKEWGLGHDEALQIQGRRVALLFDQQMSQDVPTGQTPVRKEYTFPRHLPSTSPHDRLLERYRAGTVSSFSKIPLPNLGDDTEDDASDNSTLLGCSSSGSSPAVLEEPLTYEQRSRSGSTSSLKDQGSSSVFVVPNPPLHREDSGNPLSRSSSTSSIGESKENRVGGQHRSHSTNSLKKREIKAPSVYKSTSMEKVATSSEGSVRTRRILGSQN